jgi:hypothetical protein
MTAEERLRRLMRDPGWSLPAWPDADARVRRAARRQRLATASIVAAVVLVAATAALVPLALPGTASAPVAIGHKHMTAHPFPSQSRPPRPQVIPPVGSAGFPAMIYPAAVKPRLAISALSLCPDAAGLEAPGPATPAAAKIVLHQLGKGFKSDLRVSDRSAWPLLATSWQTGGTRLFARAARTSVRYSGPLRSSPDVPAVVKHAIVAGCGRRVALATWVIVYGPAGKPALDAAIFFVTRRGHMLFFNAD